MGIGFGPVTPGGGETGTPLNLAKRLDLIERYAGLRGKSVLDCGCGTGQYILPLLARGADVSGVEWEASKVAAFSRDHADAAGRVRQGDIAALPFAPGSFDVVLLNEVLEHVPDDEAVLREARRVLTPRGLAIIFSPNRLYPFETHGVLLRHSGRRLSVATPFIPYVPLSAGRRVFEYRARNYWPSQLRRLVRRSGFAVISGGFVWQTFENISTSQPRPVRAVRPALRAFAAALERLPLVRAFGVSQMIVAQPVQPEAL